MWVRGAAIRPVPPYAVVGRDVLEQVEEELAGDARDARGVLISADEPRGVGGTRAMFTAVTAADETGGVDLRSELDDAFGRFEQTQPAVAQLAASVLARPLDETALALGYFLTIAVWLAFERTFGARLHAVSDDELKAAEDALTLEEELRATHAEEPLDLDDVMAIEQPGILAFVNEHVDAALEPSDADGHDVDVDDVHLVYRMVLVLTLALSHAVVPISGVRPRELLA